MHTFFLAASEQLTRRLLFAPSSNIWKMFPLILFNKRRDSAEHQPKYFKKLNNGITGRCKSPLDKLSTLPIHCTLFLCINYIMLNDSFTFVLQSACCNIAIIICFYCELLVCSLHATSIACLSAPGERSILFLLFLKFLLYTEEDKHWLLILIRRPLICPLKTSAVASYLNNAHSVS